MQKLIIDIWEITNKIKNHHILNIGDVYNLYGWEILQKLPVNNFEWIKDTVQFNEDFIKSIMEKVMKGIFPKFMFNILGNTWTS